MIRELDAAISKLKNMIYYAESNGELYGPYFEDDFTTDGQKARNIEDVAEMLKKIRLECIKNGIK